MGETFVREQSLGWLVAVLSASMTKALDEQLRTHNLTLKVWPTLMCLWEKEGITQAELSKTARVPGYTTTRILDRLEAAGLVERQADPNSRRAHRIYLTTAGRNLQPSLTLLAQNVNATHLAPLNLAEQKTLLRLLSNIVRDAPTTADS